MGNYRVHVKTTNACERKVSECEWSVMMMMAKRRLAKQMVWEEVTGLLQARVGRHAKTEKERERDQEVVGMDSSSSLSRESKQTDSQWTCCGEPPFVCVCMCKDRELKNI